MFQGKQLHEQIKKLGISANRFAKEAGISQSMVAQLLDGRVKTPSEATKKKMLAVFNRACGECGKLKDPR
jgi:predicted transcriptional regulator